MLLWEIWSWPGRRRLASAHHLHLCFLSTVSDMDVKQTSCILAARTVSQSPRNSLSRGGQSLVVCLLGQCVLQCLAFPLHGGPTHVLVADLWFQSCSLVLEPLLPAGTKESASPVCTLPSFMSPSTWHLQHALKPWLLPGHFRLNRSFQTGLNTPLCTFRIQTGL